MTERYADLVPIGELPDDPRTEDASWNGQFRPYDVPHHLSGHSLAAHHFTQRVGSMVRYDHALKRWYVWHGHRWRQDGSGEVNRLWRRVLADRYREAMSLDDKDARDRAIASIRDAGETAYAIRSGMEIASTNEPIATDGSGWDADPWLLGCDNGLIDLRTGALRDGTPEDMVTKSTGHDYDLTATAPRWQRFLLEVFDGDRELADWYEYVIGAALVGTSKEIILISYGGGNNGKSVCVSALSYVAGEYAVTVPVETLLNVRKEGGAPSSDIMSVRGKRLVFTSEPDRGARISSGAMKRLTSIDTISARELHGRQQQFQPTHTVHLATNHKPETEDTTEAFWRRVVPVPWNTRFVTSGNTDGPVADTGLLEKLKGEAQGILARLVAGAVRYGNVGSVEPLPYAVVSMREEYRAESNPVGEFVLNWIQPDEDGPWVKSGTVYGWYEDWYAETAGEGGEAQKLEHAVFGKRFKDAISMLLWTVETRSVRRSTEYRDLRYGPRDDVSTKGG